MKAYYPPSDKLEKVQDIVRNDPNLKKGAGGPFKRTPAEPWWTWCNIGAFNVMKKMSNILKSFIGTADSNNTRAIAMIDLMNTNVEKKILQKTTDKALATKLANQGYVVVAAWKNPEGDPGHVATVRPSSNPESFENPLVSNVGVRNSVQAEDAPGAFGKGKVIEYFWDPNQKLGN
jgi:hypothetical protein